MDFNLKELTESERDYICLLLKERIRFLENHLNLVERKVLIKDLNALLEKVSNISLEIEDDITENHRNISQKPSKEALSIKKNQNSNRSEKKSNSKTNLKHSSTKSEKKENNTGDN